jgi:tetratricopeptide (TPR) repeat protein
MHILGFIFLVASVVSSASIANADIKSFVREYTYQASEVDSKVTSRVVALVQVKRLLLEEFGIYLESHTEVINSELTLDQISTLTAGIVSVEVVKEKWDGINYSLTAKIYADPDEVGKAILALRNDKQNSKAVEKYRKMTEDLLKENAQLKNELNKIGDNKELQKTYNENIKKISAQDWALTGNAYLIKHNYLDAINALTKSIEISPNDNQSYLWRASAYRDLNKFDEALADLNQSEKINPDELLVYLQKIFIYRDTKQHEMALKECEKAKTKNSSIIKTVEAGGDVAGLAYVVCGTVYDEMKRSYDAINEYTLAIHLNDNNAIAYWQRGQSYGRKGNFYKAINDFKNVLKLTKPADEIYKNSFDLLNGCYLSLGDKFQSVKNYHEAESWYLKALNNGSIKAVSMLGGIAFVQKNYTKAYYVLNAGAEANDAESQNLLGLILQAMSNNSESNIQAYKFIKLALLNINSNSNDEFKSMVSKNFIYIKNKLSITEIKSAEELITKWGAQPVAVIIGKLIKAYPNL